MRTYNLLRNRSGGIPIYLSSKLQSPTSYLSVHYLFHSVSETHEGNVLRHIRHVLTNKKSIIEITSTDIDLSPLKLEFYTVLRQGDQHFTWTNFPPNITHDPFTVETDVIWGQDDVCALTIPSDTCNTTYHMNTCGLFFAHSRPVDYFGVDIEWLLCVKRIDVFIFIVFSRFTVTGFRKLYWCSSPTSLFHSIKDSNYSPAWENCQMSIILVNIQFCSIMKIWRTHTLHTLRTHLEDNKWAL